MRFGVFSDAHGNPHATAACIRVLRDRGAERLLFLGDAIGYLGHPRETIEMIEEVAAVCLIGNHEAYALGRASYPPEREPAYRTQEAARDLGAAGLARMDQRAPFWVHREASGDILFVHGSPWDPLSGCVYPDTHLAAFAHLPYRAVVMGHTHRPFVERSGQTLVLNCGSCGLPRDRGDLGSCALVDTDTLEVDIVRFPIDAGLAIQGDPGVHESVVRLFSRRPADDGPARGGSA